MGLCRAPPGPVAQQSTIERGVAARAPIARRGPDRVDTRHRDAGANPAGPGTTVPQLAVTWRECTLADSSSASRRRRGPLEEGYLVRRNAEEFESPARPCRSRHTRAGRSISVILTPIPWTSNPGTEAHPSSARSTRQFRRTLTTRP
jgi:hypothetical protein